MSQPSPKQLEALEDRYSKYEKTNRKRSRLEEDIDIPAGTPLEVDEPSSSIEDAIEVGKKAAMQPQDTQQDTQDRVLQQDPPQRKQRLPSDLQAAKKGEPSFTLNVEGEKVHVKERRAFVEPKLTVSMVEGENGMEVLPKIDNIQLTPEQVSHIVNNIIDLQNAALLRSRVETASTVFGIALSVVAIIAGVMAIRQGVFSVIKPD